MPDDNGRDWPPRPGTRAPLPFRILFLFISSRGRVGRLGFWMGVMGLVVWTLIVLYLVRRSLDEPIPAMVAALPIGLPAYCVLAKRLHDMGRDARTAPLPGVVAAGVLSYAARGWDSPVLMLLLAGAGGLVIGLLIVLGIMPGQEDDNRFGPAPGREVERTARVFD